MFHRTIIDDLRAWAERPNRKPLILRGARQVGKTTAVNFFGRDFETYIRLDLEKTQDADLFEHNLEVEELVQAIYLSRNIVGRPGKTLLFFDEIQNSPKAVAALRFFYEDMPELHVIGAGSLLETMMGHRRISFPVGRVEFRFMYPMTFREFLIACDVGQALKLYDTIPLPAFAHAVLKKLFHEYTLIGGMPEVVKSFEEHRDVPSLASVYQALLTSYFDDIAKYARNSKMVEITKFAIEAAPLQAGRRIKFHGFGNSNYGSREMGEALRTLERAMLVHLIYPTTKTEPPLIPDHKKSPKLQFLDTGLINFVGGLQGNFFKETDLHSFYRGILAEHVVAQELLAVEAYRLSKPVFWVRQSPQSNAEVDFIWQIDRWAVPVEVKSGKTGRLRSLHEFVERARHPYAARLYSAELSIDECLTTPSGSTYRLLNLPYFLAGKLTEYLAWFLSKWQ